MSHAITILSIVLSTGFAVAALVAERKGNTTKAILFMTWALFAGSAS